MAMAADMRIATPRTRTGFLFAKVGLAGCDMGACAILPRIIGQGRASELLYTGRFMSAEEGERWGFHNRLGDAGWLRYCVPAAYGGISEKLDVRSLALIRDTLSRHSGLADFAFAMQGLG